MATSKLNEELLKAYINTSEKFEQFICNTKEFVAELRVTNELNQKLDEKRDKLLETVIENNNRTEGRMIKIELILKNQEEIIESNTKNIEELQDERNFNTVRFGNSKIPVIITAGLTAIICSVIFSFLIFMKSNNIKP